MSMQFNSQSEDGSPVREPVREFQTPRCRRKGRLQFAAACVSIALVWLVVLPYLGSRPAIQSAIRQQERQGIDPSAMFYTELEVMDSVLSRMDAIQDRNPAAFWVPKTRQVKRERGPKKVH